MLLLLMMSLASFAGPRSFQQAKEIALRQAAQLGISMDEASSAKAKSKRVKSVSGEVPAYIMSSRMARARASLSFLVMTACQKW